ncbi:MAG: mechanosensitive ion channel domain-containing protein [Bacteroidota bacterium]
MKFRFYPFKALIFCALFLIPGFYGMHLSAQVQKAQNVKDNSDSIVITPIPATKISSEYDESVKLISHSAKLRITEQQVAEMELRIDTISASVAQFLEDSILQSLEGANIRELDNADNLVDFQVGQIDDLQSLLTNRTREIEGAMLDLTHAHLRWQLTKEHADEKGIPEALQVRIDQIIGQIDTANQILNEDFNTLLVGEDALSSRNSRLKALQDSISVRKEEISKNIFSRDMPTFFEDLENLEDTAMIQHHRDELRSAFRSDFRVISKKFRSQVWIIAFLTLAFIIYAFWFNRNREKLIPGDQFELNSIQLSLIENPVASGLFIAMIVIRIFFNELANSLQAINLFILMVPMIIIVLRRQSDKASPWIELLIGFYLATYFYDLYYYPDIVQRIMLMVLSLSGSVYFLLVLLKKTVILKVENKFVFRFLRLMLGLIALLCFAAIFWNLGGAFRMAEYFTLAFIEITMLLLVIFVATQVVSALVYLILAGKTMQELYVVREDCQLIHKKVTRLFNLLLWVYFFVGTLEYLNYKDKFLAWGSETLNTGWDVGAVKLTPASILIFLFIIWLSVIISRIITQLLEKDVFTRVSISKGMPNTINMLLKIILISCGFFLAAAAAGMHLSNLSIIIGAFSVGIGFGLQNIFNNMVSGLILAFERPIKVGDTVQVGELMGVVKSISFRSSTIRSFDGAEVIVPNGNLISDSMTNWTRSDFLRRMDIRVGVAYGTDPEIVLGILRDVAGEHDLVRKKPAPSAYFIGFGDSSLDFRLLGWTDIDHRLKVESELHVRINKKLDEAGIEIPFPQSDLHIRSDDTKS